MCPAGDDSTALEEQKDYYEARAAEYDEWWLRRGRYDHGAEANRAWFDDVDELEALLAGIAPEGRVLELAGGTGIWTEKLLASAAELTVVDASAASLGLNRARVASGRVRYVEADLFAWQADQQYDFVFFSFWLSHVPAARFAAFWRLVDTCLAPSGRVFFIDSVRRQMSTSMDQTVPDSGEIMGRKLNDGRSFRVFKIYYEPAALEQRLSDLGWTAEVGQTSRYFVFGSARRRERQRH